ncbi:MAG: NAD(P)-dependent oxidoreductase [Pseudomonadales bacterium]|nr:NAD(P)-dependent oxidoreductase [Pseudomonadales bacterium]
MKILITGALGNLGILCIEESLARGYDVRCLDLDNPQNQRTARKLQHRYGSRIAFAWGDISQIALHTNLLANIEAIFHNACILPPGTEFRPDLAFAVNVDGTRQLIRLAEQQAQKVRFVYPSSVTVFGPRSSHNKAMGCEDPTIASDHYTQHKLLCESSLKASNLDWVIFRVGVSVDSRTTKTDLATLKQLLRTDPDNRLEYVHPKDVAFAMCAALTHQDVVHRTLLIGGGKHCQITQREFLNAALGGCGLHLGKHSFGNAPYYTHWMDTDESQQLLNYQHHTFAHYRQEMADTFKTTRRLLAPIRPLANWFLNRVARALTAQ